MFTKKIMFYSFLFIINATTLHGMQKFQTYRTQLLAQIHKDQKTVNDLEKKMSEIDLVDHRSFNQTLQKCNKDQTNDNVNKLCPSCTQVLNATSVNAKRFIMAKYYLKKCTDRYNELYAHQPLYDPFNTYNTHNIQIYHKY